MAQRALAMVKPETLAINGTDGALVDMDFIVCISGSDHGTYPTGLPTLHFEGLDPAATNMSIEALIKTDMLAHSVPFGVLDTDTVRIF